MENNAHKVAREVVGNRVVSIDTVIHVHSEVRDVAQVNSDPQGTGVVFGCNGVRQGFVVGKHVELSAFKEVVRNALSNILYLSSARESRLGKKEKGSHSS